MRIGVPRESKDQEFRVGATPDGVRLLIEAGPRGVWSSAGPAWAAASRTTSSARPARGWSTPRRPGRRPTWW